MATAARKGRRNGGPRPFGFDQSDAQLTQRPDEVAVAGRIFREFVAGKRQARIAADLNADGHRTARKKLWNQAQISHLLHDARWIGHTRRQINGRWELFEHTHEPVVAAEVFEQAQQLLSSTGRNARPTLRFLLGNGLLRCGRCGNAMRVKRERKQYGWYEVYICSGRYSGTAECAQPAVPRARVDLAVLHYFENVSLDVDAMVAEQEEARGHRHRDVRARIGNAQKSETRAEGQLEHLATLLRDRQIDPQEWRRLSSPPSTEQAAAKAALDDLRKEEYGILAEADLADAEQETLEALAALRAAVAGEIAGAAEISAAQAALRRIFAEFVLHDLRDIADSAGRVVRLPRPRRSLTDAEGWIIEPVPHPQMIVSESFVVAGQPFYRERLRRIPLRTTGGGSKASAR